MGHFEHVFRIQVCICLETCKSGKDEPESLERVDVVSNAWLAALQFADTELDKVLFIERRISVCVSCSFFSSLGGGCACSTPQHHSFARTSLFQRCLQLRRTSISIPPHFLYNECHVAA